MLCLLQVLATLPQLEQLSAAILCLPLPVPLPGVTSLKVRDVQTRGQPQPGSLAASLPALQQLSVSNLTQPIALLRALRGHKALRVLGLMLDRVDYSPAAAAAAANTRDEPWNAEASLGRNMRRAYARRHGGPPTVNRAEQIIASWSHEELGSMPALEMLRVDADSRGAAGYLSHGSASAARRSRRAER